MEKLTNFFESKWTKIFLGTVGFFSFSLQIIKVSLPTIADIAVIISGYVAGIYWFLVIAFWFGSKFIEYVGNRIHEIIVNKLVILPIDDTSYPHAILDDDELVYSNQLERFGYGYQSFKLSCDIAKDGSASILRDIELHASSQVESVDSFLRIPEDDPSGTARIITEGVARSKDDHILNLRVVKQEKQTIHVEIDIQPPLASGDILPFEMTGWNIPKGVFGYDLTKAELSKKESDSDYIAWHVIRPTRELTLEAILPDNRRPKKMYTRVFYATAAADPSEKRIGIEEDMLPGIRILSENGRMVLRLTVNYPLSGLVYALGWSPIMKTD